MSSLEPVPLTLSGPLSEPVVVIDGQAHFRLMYAPDDGQDLTTASHEVSEAILPCVVSDSVLAASLAGLEPGTFLHLTGYLAVPGIDGNPLRLVVIAVAVESPAADRFTVAEEAAQHGEYLAIRTLAADGPGERWHLIHPSGTYAGCTSTPDQIPAAIQTHRTADGSTGA